MGHRTDLTEIIEYIDPSGCGYQEWVSDCPDAGAAV